MASGVLPAWASNPADANLDELAGPMAGASTYEPSNDSLVSGQLERLLSQDSPYLTAARTRATQLANKRGLLNSSIAATSGERAAIESALPIAQADAATYGQAQRYNTDATNTFARDRNSYLAEGALAKFGGVLDQQARNDEQTMQRELAAADEAFRQKELGFRESSTGRELDIREQDLASQRALQQQELDAKVSDAAAERQAALASEVADIRKQAIDARTRLESDPNMTADAKREAIIALGNQATADIRELVQLSGIDLPDAWPEWINELTPTSGATDGGGAGGFDGTNPNGSPRIDFTTLPGQGES